MRKLDKRWTVRLGALALAAALLGTAALAAGGDQNDPLVTLSYLEQTALPQVVKQVEEGTAVRQKELEDAFSRLIEEYAQNGGQTGTGSSASFALVTMTSGQVMSLEVGCEVLLRVGAVTVTADSAPALIDMSSAGTVNTGASLTQNHLYLCTIPDRSLTAAAGTVKLLVRGGYTLA